MEVSLETTGGWEFGRIFFFAAEIRPCRILISEMLYSKAWGELTLKRWRLCKGFSCSPEVFPKLPKKLWAKAPKQNGWEWNMIVSFWGKGGLFSGASCLFSGTATCCSVFERTCFVSKLSFLRVFLAKNICHIPLKSNIASQKRCLGDDPVLLGFRNFSGASCWFWGGYHPWKLTWRAGKFQAWTNQDVSPMKN